MFALILEGNSKHFRQIDDASFTLRHHVRTG